MNEQHRMQCNISKSAVATLVGLGYTDRGGEQWAPPIGKAPDFNLLDAANAQIAELQAQLSAIGAGGVEALRKRECLQQSADAGAVAALKGLLSLVRREAPQLSGKVLGDAESAIAALQAAPPAERCQGCGYLVTQSEHKSCIRAAARAQEHATQLAGQGQEHRPNWLPFSVRLQIAARHGTKVTAEFNKLVRDVIETYIATYGAAPAQAHKDEQA